MNSKTQVIIVGAGPTSLMLANQLMRFKIDFILVDFKSGPTDQSRALAVSARSMELYQQLNLSDTVMQESTEIIGFEIFQNGKIQANINLENMGEGLSDFPNFMNAFEQSKNESLLSENLTNNGMEIFWNWEFLSFEEVDGKVYAQIKNTETQETKTIESFFLVGCDGASSPVRHQLNFSFKGGTYENKFFVVDTKIDWGLPYNKIILAPSDYQFIAFFPLKGDKRMRVIGTLPKSFSDTEEIDIERLEVIIKEITKIDLDFTDRGWNSIYKLHHRAVPQFSRGSIFLAGDAAHIHSPAGGQGMNTGLQDAHNLGWKLAMVLKGFSPISLLNTYNEERLPVAKRLLRSTDQGFNFMAGDGFFERTFRKTLLIPLVSTALKMKNFQKFAFKKIAQIDYSYHNQSLSKTYTKQKLKFKSGDRFPYVAPHFYENFRDASFNLVCIAKDGSQIPKEIELQFDYPVRIIHELLDENLTKLGVSNTLYIMVRPDEHILWISDNVENSTLAQLISK